MLYRAFRWTLMLVLVTAQVLYPMRKEDPDRPEDTPLTQHLKNFAQKKTRRAIQQLEAPAPDEQTELQAHQERFFRVSTRPVHYQELEAPPKVKTELQKKVEAHSLRLAAANNNIEKMKALLFESDDPNATNPVNRKTTVHYAAMQGHAQALGLLLDHPLINLEAIDSDRHPPLCYSIVENHPQCIRLLLQHRAWVGPDSNKYNCLHAAVFSNQLNALITLLMHPLDPLIPIDPSNNLLELDSNQEESIQKFLQRGFIKEILRMHIEAWRNADCTLLSKLWGSPFSFNLPSNVCEDLSKLMNFYTIYQFIHTFPASQREKMACHFAPFYAKRHVYNLNKLLVSPTNNNQTPFDLAQALTRDPLMQSLVDPQSVIASLNIMLQCVPAFSGILHADPAKQDPFVLFYHLFKYQLLGGDVSYNNPLAKQ